MRNNGWTNALFALIFLATPALIIIFWVLGLDFINIGIKLGIGFGYLVYGFLFSIIAWKVKWLAINSLTFNIPITLVMSSLMMTYGLDIWISAIVVFAMVMIAFPINIWVSKK